MRRTVTIHDDLFRQLQQIRAAFISSGTWDEMTFTTAVNLVLYGGLIATDYFTPDDWKKLSDFLKNEGESLDLDSATDRRADVYLKNLNRLDDSQPDAPTG